MKRNKNKTEIQQLAIIGMFCALAYASMLVIKIPVQFLDLDVKDAIIILCGLIFGPVSAVAVSVIVPTLQFLTISSTGYYGLIMNILSSLSFSLVASLIYKYKKTFRGAIAALLCGIFSMTAVMMVANLIITPHFMHVPTETVAKLIPTLLLPFNLTKAVLNGAIVLLLYKPLSNALKRTGLLGSSSTQSNENPKKSMNFVVAALSVVIIALSLAVIFFVLK